MLLVRHAAGVKLRGASGEVGREGGERSTFSTPPLVDGEDEDELGTEMGEVGEETEDVEAADGDGPRDELGSGLHAG